MLVLIILGILITVAAVALTVRAMASDDPGPRRFEAHYDSRHPSRDM
jgi:hypothetical protein